MRFDFEVHKQSLGRRAASRSKHESLHGWSPAGSKEFQAMLDKELEALEQHKIEDDVPLSTRLEVKFMDIERILVRLACSCKPIEEIEENQHDASRNKLRQLTSDRRIAKTTCDQAESRRLCKIIQKEVRAITRVRKKSQIGKILAEFKGLRFITSIQSGNKKHYVGSMIGADESYVTDRRGIADVFADFYADLYSRRNGGTEHFVPRAGNATPMANVTAAEVRKRL